LIFNFGITLKASEQEGSGKGMTPLFKRHGLSTSPIVYIKSCQYF